MCLPPTSLILNSIVGARAPRREGHRGRSCSRGEAAAGNGVAGAAIAPGVGAGDSLPPPLHKFFRMLYLVAGDPVAAFYSSSSSDHLPPHGFAFSSSDIIATSKASLFLVHLFWHSYERVSLPDLLSRNHFALDRMAKTPECSASPLGRRTPPSRGTPRRYSSPPSTPLVPPMPPSAPSRSPDAHGARSSSSPAASPRAPPSSSLAPHTWSMSQLPQMR